MLQTTKAPHRRGRKEISLCYKKVWQDVYRRKTQAGEVYLKLTVIDDVLIVSFKEL